MSVKKVKGGYKVTHCSGKNKGRPIDRAKATTKKKAVARHRAIQASKYRRKK